MIRLGMMGTGNISRDALTPAIGEVDDAVLWSVFSRERERAEAFAAAVQALRDGEIVGVYPEATISRSFELKEFKTGAARMALQAQVPIVPLVVWGAHRKWTKDHPRALGRTKTPVSVAVGAPLAPEGSVAVVDAALRASGADASLTGATAIANARAAYALFQQAFTSERFAVLRAKGARPQRPLWASTSTKDPSLPDTLYVDQLIGVDTVNTMPPATLDATLDHGTSVETLSGTAALAAQHLEAIAAAGIDLHAVTAKLLSDGLDSFAKSFDEVVASIEAKCGQLAEASR